MNKQTEYITLYNQILASEKYAFEKVAILGFLSLLCMSFTDDASILWISFASTFLLLWNLHFTIINFNKATTLKIYLQETQESDSKITFNKFLHLRKQYELENQQNYILLMQKGLNGKDVFIDNDIIQKLKYINMTLSVIFLFIPIVGLSNQSVEYNGLTAFIAGFGILSVFIVLVVSIVVITSIKDMNIVGERLVTQEILKNYSN